MYDICIPKGCMIGAMCFVLRQYVLCSMCYVRSIYTIHKAYWYYQVPVVLLYCSAIGRIVDNSRPRQQCRYMFELREKELRVIARFRRTSLSAFPLKRRRRADEKTTAPCTCTRSMEYAVCTPYKVVMHVINGHETQQCKLQLLGAWVSCQHISTGNPCTR